jgi:microcystin-dependent protein
MKTASPSSPTNPTVGEIFLFAGDDVPPGFAPLDGQLLAIQEHVGLFPIVGTMYGGDGRTTFALPDMRGRAAVHAGRHWRNEHVQLGQRLGLATRQLRGIDLPRHTHDDAATGAGPAGGGRPIENFMPVLGISFAASLEGMAPAPAVPGEAQNPASTPASDFLGMVRLFAGNFAPGGAVMANGQLLPISTKHDLFDVIGTTYGGDGEHSFALPDLGGRLAMGANADPRLGVREAELGQQVGEASVTLTVDQMASHSHTVAGGVPTPAAGGDQPVENMQPTLAMNYLIAVRGVTPARDETAQPAAADGPWLGQVVLFAGDAAPAGWLFARGQTLAIADHPGLFALLGTTYGGNGTTNFNLPDLRGRVPIHPGEAPGLPAVGLGEQVGVDTVRLEGINLPAHTHDLGR